MSETAGSLIRKCRAEAKPKLNLDDLAEATNLNAGTISRMERRGSVTALRDPNVREQMLELFTRRHVPRSLIADLERVLELTLLTGGTTVDEDAELVGSIFRQLKKFNPPTKEAYKAELRSRKGVWEGYHFANEDFSPEGTGADFEDTLRSLSELANLAKVSTTNYDSRLALLTGSLHRYLANLPQAQKHLTEAIDLARRSGDQSLLADALTERGDYYRRSNRGQLPAAFEDYKNAREISLAQKNPEATAFNELRLASVGLTSGLAEIKLSDIGKTALELSDASLAYAIRNRRRQLERKSLEYKAWAFAIGGRPDKAVELQLDADGIARGLGVHKKELAKSITYLGGFYAMVDNVEAASQCFRDANSYVDDVVKEMRKPSDEVHVSEIILRGYIYLGLGSMEAKGTIHRSEREANLVQSLNISERLNDALASGRALQYLGESHLAAGNGRQAREQLRAAQFCYRDAGLQGLPIVGAGNPYYLASIILDFARLEYEDSKHPQAIELLDQASKIASEFKYREILLRAYLWKVLVLATQPEKQEEKQQIAGILDNIIQQWEPTYDYLVRVFIDTMKHNFESLNKSNREAASKLATIVLAQLNKQMRSPKFPNWAKDDLTHFLAWLKERQQGWNAIEGALKLPGRSR